jgi:hypothetical protein
MLSLNFEVLIPMIIMRSVKDDGSLAYKPIRKRITLAQTQCDYFDYISIKMFI